ncbi:hypothetical protein GMD53_07310 [Ruthenibacterium lactatiformans]|nr:hypothetical protein [Ruthenibacterium lactatiformans]
MEKSNSVTGRKLTKRLQTAIMSKEIKACPALARAAAAKGGKKGCAVRRQGRPCV